MQVGLPLTLVLQSRPSPIIATECFPSKIFLYRSSWFYCRKKVQPTADYARTFADAEHEQYHAVYACSKLPAPTSFPQVGRPVVVVCSRHNRLADSRIIPSLSSEAYRLYCPLFFGLGLQEGRRRKQPPFTSCAPTNPTWPSCSSAISHL